MINTPSLFQPVSFRSVTARNRIVVSPMCQYSADNGLGNDWHLQNLGAKAAGGAGIVFVEATHVSAAGRITPSCLGLWNDSHQGFLTRVADLIRTCGAVPAIQLAHAGRKASTTPPWDGGTPIPAHRGGWVPLAPSPLPYDPASPPPHALTATEIDAVIAQIASAARRARTAGFGIVEVHAAHGYLLHSFLSPLSNHRTDGYGGTATGRMRLLMDVLDAVRAEWPGDLPLFVRLSCTDWVDGGLTPDDAIDIARQLAARGDVDLVDCSSGGLSPAQVIPSLHPGYQVPFAEGIRAATGMATGAVGLIQTPDQAADVIASGRADLVFLARAVLADPAWPLRAAKSLNVTTEWPRQYRRGTLT